MLFALACLAWGLGLLLERRLPRLRAVHVGLALYVGWAALSLAMAAPARRAARPSSSGF